MVERRFDMVVLESDGTKRTTRIVIPAVRGTHKLQFNLSNGDTIDVGNMIVSEAENRYNLKLGLMNGDFVDVGDILTPPLSYMFSVSADSHGYILHVEVKASADGATVRYADITKVVAAYATSLVTITTSDTQQTSGKVVVTGALRVIPMDYTYTDSEGKSHSERWKGIMSIEHFDHTWEEIPTSLVLEKILPSIPRIPHGVKSIGDSAFSVEADVIIPDSVINMGSDALHSSGSLFYEGSTDDWCRITRTGFSTPLSRDIVINGERPTHINIPGDLTAIQPYTFAYGFKSLVSVDIPPSIVKIGARAFFDCEGLTAILLPSGVTKIQERAFAGCDSLNKFEFSGTMLQWGNIEKGNRWNEGSPFTEIVCSDGIVKL